FFQAEDGIRDFHVTGVQTCALPIWSYTSIVNINSSTASSSRSCCKPSRISNSSPTCARAKNSCTLYFSPIDQSSCSTGLGGHNQDRKSVRVGKEARSRRQS